MADIGWYPQAVQQQYEADPRLAYAQMLMKQGQGNQPIRTQAQGWSNVLASALGKYQQDNVQKEYGGKADQYRQAQQQMTAALLSGKPPEEIGQMMASNPQMQDQSLPFAMSTYTAKQSAAAKAKEREQARAEARQDKAQTQLTPQEAADLGLPAGGVYQKDAFGAISKVYAPEQITPYQREQLALDRQKIAQQGQITPYQKAQLDLDREKLAATKGPANLSESEGKAVTYGQRAVSANQKLGKLEQGGYQAANTRDRAAANLPFGNQLVSPQGQQYDQAKREFVSAILRRDSGATITETEFDNADKTYFPQWGDSPATIAQKAAAREGAISALAAGSGKGQSLIDQRPDIQINTPMPTGKVKFLGFE